MERLFKPPFKVVRTKISSASVVDANQRLVARFDAGQARFWQTADEVAESMNNLYKFQETNDEQSGN